MAGKGDRPRPVDGKKYRENYDRIFRSPGTLAFAENRCAENRKRIEREKNGDYGQCIQIVCEKV